MPSAYYLPKNIKMISERGDFQREKYFYFFKKCEEIWKEQLKKKCNINNNNGLHKITRK